MKFKDLLDTICDYSGGEYEDAVVVISSLKYHMKLGFVREVDVKTPYGHFCVWNGKRFLVDVPKIEAHLDEVLEKLEKEFLNSDKKQNEAAALAEKYITEHWG